MAPIGISQYGNIDYTVYTQVKIILVAQYAMFIARYHCNTIPEPRLATLARDSKGAGNVVSRAGQMCRRDL